LAYETQKQYLHRRFHSHILETTFFIKDVMSNIHKKERTSCITVFNSTTRLRIKTLTKHTSWTSPPLKMRRLSYFKTSARSYPF
jgi:hypothetical protein